MQKYFFYQNRLNIPAKQVSCTKLKMVLMIRRVGFPVPPVCPTFPNFLVPHLHREQSNILSKIISSIYTTFRFQSYYSSHSIPKFKLIIQKSFGHLWGRVRKLHVLFYCYFFTSRDTQRTFLPLVLCFLYVKKFFLIMSKVKKKLQTKSKAKQYLCRINPKLEKINYKMQMI